MAPGVSRLSALLLLVDHLHKLRIVPADEAELVNDVDHHREAHRLIRVLSLGQVDLVIIWFVNLSGRWRIVVVLLNHLCCLHSRLWGRFFDHWFNDLIAGDLLDVRRLLVGLKFEIELSVRINRRGNHFLGNVQNRLLVWRNRR